ncbi:MAG: DUF642 domain-containing protein [Parashewanella sp.]
MNNKFKLSLVFAALSLSSSFVSAEPLALGNKNFVNDGDFESPRLNLGEHYRRFEGFHGRNHLGPWQVYTTHWAALHRNGVIDLGLAGAKGSQHIGLSRALNMRQYISGLTPNTTYNLQLDYALHTMASKNGDVEFRVNIAPSRAEIFKVTETGNKEWKTADFNFTAKSGTQSLWISGWNSPNRHVYNHAGALLDNISIREVKLNIVSQNLVNSSHRNTLTIQKGAQVEVVSSVPERNGNVFEVTPELYERCQFADYSKFGEKGDRNDKIAVNQGPLLPLGPKIRIIGDYALESDMFTKSHPDNKYHFVYGDYDKDQIRVVTSDLCRTGKGKFTLQLVDKDDHTADIKNGQQNAIVDVNSKPVALGDEYVIQAQKPEALFAVNRKDFMSCELSDSSIKVADFDENNGNKLTLAIHDSASENHAKFTPGNTVYLVQAENGVGESQSCKDGAKFSVRVSK